eukprot:scaffold146219_cov14-Tisochrysis_lutea.AAC.1
MASSTLALVHIGTLAKDSSASKAWGGTQTAGSGASPVATPLATKQPGALVPSHLGTLALLHIGSRALWLRTHQHPKHEPARNQQALPLPTSTILP